MSLGCSMGDIFMVRALRECSFNVTLWIIVRITSHFFWASIVKGWLTSEYSCQILLSAHVQCSCTDKQEWTDAQLVVPKTSHIFKKHKEEPNEIVFPQTEWRRKVNPDLGPACVSKSWVGLLSALAMLSTWPRESLRSCSECANSLRNFSRKCYFQALPVFERYPGGKKEQSSWSFRIP